MQQDIKEKKKEGSLSIIKKPTVCSESVTTDQTLSAQDFDKDKKGSGEATPGIMVNGNLTPP